MSSVRSVLVAALVLVPAGCRSAPPTVTPQLVPDPPEADPEGPPAEAEDETGSGSPTDRLSALHFAPVTIEESLTVPEGFVVVYLFDRLQSEIGELAADDVDPTDVIDAEIAACEDERASLPEEEQEWLEYEERSCETEVVTTLFQDDQLVPDCMSLGVAYFDSSSTLLSHHEVLGPCVDRIHRFELRDLSPREEPDVLLAFTTEVYGELTRGGWGTQESIERLHVYAPGEVDGAPDLQELGAFELDEDREGGACNNGIHRVLRVGDDHALEIYSQAWDGCDHEGCVDPDDAPEDLDPDFLCPEIPEEPVERDRAEWDEDEGAWEEPYPDSWEGTELPRSNLD